MDEPFLIFMCVSRKEKLICEKLVFNLSVMNYLVMGMLVSYYFFAKLLFGIAI